MKDQKKIKKKDFKEKITKFFEVFVKKTKEDSSEINLENLLDTRIKSEKPLKIDEKKIISNVFKLPEKLISDIMVPRSDIISISTSNTIEDLVKLIGRTNHSRYPVHDKNRDNIIGMIHIKDVVTLWDSKKKINIVKLVRKILFAPPSMNVLDLILEMRKTHTHMALIVDEHGGVDGLVTIEDLVEEIVGEIKDEHEAQKDSKVSSSIKSDGNIIINARMQIEEFEEKYGQISLKKNEYKDIDTMGGLIFTILGRVPLKGEIIKHHSGCEFEILDADPRKIRKILIRNHRQI
jgi:CBS domain containing-hemolysin-like protein